MEENINQSKSWYDKIGLVIILCIVFFPVGLYALWKNSTILKGWKIAITAIIAIIVIVNIGDSDKNEKTTSSSALADSTSIAKDKAKNDSLMIVNNEKFKHVQDSVDKVLAIQQKEWNNSKAGKIQKKHPDWTNEECENIAGHKVWIGMTLEMLKYERGNPNRANPSNYGNGNQWQWCWDDYTPSCFYGGDDQIISSYN